MKTASFCIALAALTMAGAADAATVPECMVRVLQPVTDDLGNRWDAGKLLPVTILRRDANGASYCTHGGSCIPRMRGAVQVVRLTNCRPGAALGHGDYRLDPDPRTMGRADAKRAMTARGVGDRLAALGFSNAAIGSWSEDYVAHPDSPNGRLVARALAGSKPAIAAMRAKRS
ncbi:hypothetical protein FHT00_002896 [Sphingomonas insulae]|uniref:Uncharacterized protein n=1 Tax=Sphingomonas insulae TaxID=424800 RepID=A0ABN1HNB6_9SPHN|nr:hypothetical protein [Sphingomonas insulae]NIJ30923.1 hypothetical protein [Sphingomonas insulae]